MIVLYFPYRYFSNKKYILNIINISTLNWEYRKNVFFFLIHCNADFISIYGNHFKHKKKKNWLLKTTPTVKTFQMYVIALFIFNLLYAALLYLLPSCLYIFITMQIHLAGEGPDKNAAQPGREFQYVFFFFHLHLQWPYFLPIKVYFSCQST